MLDTKFITVHAVLTRWQEFRDILRMAPLGLFGNA